MAKQLYEEKNIKAIADKIRDLAPLVYKGFTTAEMPDGIEIVYEEGVVTVGKPGISDESKLKKVVFS